MGYLGGQRPQRAENPQQRLCRAGKQNYLKAPGSLNKMAKQLLSLEKSFDTSSFFNPHHSPLGWALEMAKWMKSKLKLFLYPFIWACKNYDGDVQSDSVAQGKELEDKWRWGLACGQQVVPRCGKRDAIALGKAHEMVALQDIQVHLLS